MKEEKLVRIGFKKTILMILFILAIIFGVLFIIYHFKTTPFSNTTTTTATTSSGLTSKTTIYSDTRKSIPEYSTEKYILYSASINSTYATYKKLVKSDFQLVDLDNIFVTSNNELELYLNNYFNPGFFYLSVNGEKINEFFDDDFFKKYNLAIEMYDVSSSYTSSIASVISNGDDATINIKVNTSEKDFNPTNIPISTSIIELHNPTINLIALDKEIKNVNFDVYKNTIYNYDIDYEKLFIAGGVISIAVIIIVLLIVLSHNHKIKSISNNSYNKSLSKRIIIGIIILILILTILYFSYLFCEALMTPNLIDLE